MFKIVHRFLRPVKFVVQPLVIFGFVHAELGKDREKE